MEEYEYSKVVDNLDKYINYCNDNGYILSVSNQVRTIYRNNGLMARITINDIDGVVTKELDFKEDKLSDSELIVRKESMALEFNDDNVVESILDFLNYKKDNTLIRKRYTYIKDDIKFELDEYSSPDKKLVASIEGNKEIVDKIWNELNQ